MKRALQHLDDCLVQVDTCRRLLDRAAALENLDQLRHNLQALSAALSDAATAATLAHFLAAGGQRGST